MEQGEHLGVVEGRGEAIERQREPRPVGVEAAAEGADGGQGGAGLLDGGAQVRREVHEDGGDVAGGGAELVDKGGRERTRARRQSRGSALTAAYRFAW